MSLCINDSHNGLRNDKKNIIENTLNTKFWTKKKWTFPFHSNMSRQLNETFSNIPQKEILNPTFEKYSIKNREFSIHSNIYCQDFFFEYFENLKSKIHFELTRYMFLKWRFTMRFKDATFSWACKDFHWQIWIGTVQFLLILFGLDFTATFYFRS